MFPWYIEASVGDEIQFTFKGNSYCFFDKNIEIYDHNRDSHYNGSHTIATIISAESHHSGVYTCFVHKRSRFIKLLYGKFTLKVFGKSLLVFIVNSYRYDNYFIVIFVKIHLCILQKLSAKAALFFSLYLRYILVSENKLRNEKK